MKVKTPLKRNSMPRLLPTKRSEKQSMIIWATFDYYGKGLKKRDVPKARDIAIYLMGRKRGVKLSEEQVSDMWAIRENLLDKLYCESLVHDSYLKRF